MFYLKKFKNYSFFMIFLVLVEYGIPQHFGILFAEKQWKLNNTTYFYHAKRQYRGYYREHFPRHQKVLIFRS